jgi:Nif-specific regulatory protein
MATVNDREAGDSLAAERTEDADAGAAHGLKETLANIERDLILEALRNANGNKARAARSLGITERLMGLRVKRLGIDWRALRPRRHLPPRIF